MRVARLALERTRGSLLKSSPDTSEGASETAGRRFRPFRSTAPRGRGSGFVQAPCDSLDIHGGDVPVSSGGTSVRRAGPEAEIPDALCPAVGVMCRLAERRRGDRRFRSALENLR